MKLYWDRGNILAVRISTVCTAETSGRSKTTTTTTTKKQQPSTSPIIG